ncbi:ADP-ribosylation factor family-domain-containing protein [Cladochytrium replicatum]|nr:ADP-ribosylation factor family-domain-containing protein [Cladochytrium replicatum]
MTAFWTNVLTSLGLLRKRANVLCVGLDNSGKSTILNHFKAEKIQPNEIVPTVGFNVETFSFRSKVRFTVFDMSGQGKYRDLWQNYFHDTDAVIFVVDSADRVRACVARDELENILGNRALQSRKVPILFFANKMDLDGALLPSECAVALALEKIRDRNWTICACNALSGEGLEQGLDWLAGIFIVKMHFTE